MGCPGFNLPAGRFCPATKVAADTARRSGRQSICSRCYAQSGRYRFRNVKEALARRADWWESEDIIGRIRGIANELSRKRTRPYFRAYDSGDLDTPAACHVWAGLSMEFPETLFWVPTKTWVFPEWLPHLRELNEIPNVVVRPSARCFDDPPPVVEDLSAGHSGALNEPVKADWVCPGKCGDCRICWTEPGLSVNFKNGG